MKTSSIVVALLFALGCSYATAQAPGPDPIGENIFPPELVVQQQQAIGLTDSQKELLRAEVRQAQSKLTDLQWQLSDEVEKLASMLKQDTATSSAPARNSTASSISSAISSARSSGW